MLFWLRIRSSTAWIPDGTVHQRDNQWGIPRKRALFVSDGPDSTTSGSDVLEGHYGRPPDDGYPGIANSGRPQEVHSQEELCSPSRQLEEAVVRQDSIGHRLRRSLLGLRNGRGLRRRQSNWEQYRQVFEAIVCSNGWDDVTAALQLLSHLDGDALNVALLDPQQIRLSGGRAMIRRFSP